MRAYSESHPWITFKATDFNELGPRSWMLLGEARAQCEHLAGAPLPPAIARSFYEVALVKGAQATTAIEGNTLTEQQVAGILDGTFQAPPSRAYQEREVRNALDALQAISEQVTADGPHEITVDLLCGFNRQLLGGTEPSGDAVPGVVRDHEVVVADYRGAPARDCEYLLECLAGWLESDDFKSEDPEIGFARTVARSVYAHLYIAWLHPFGDGNGRTARLLEFAILAGSGLVPLPTAHLLSNHYNLTRDRYYRELSRASRSRNTAGFAAYAIQGFTDGLREQNRKVREFQLAVAWNDYVHQTMRRYPPSPARDRQRDLVLAMPPDRDTLKDHLPMLTPALAASYATKSPRTLSRDLNRLREAGLVRKRSKGWTANQRTIEAFLPPAAQGDT